MSKYQDVNVHLEWKGTGLSKSASYDIREIVGDIAVCQPDRHHITHMYLFRSGGAPECLTLLARLVASC